MEGWDQSSFDRTIEEYASVSKRTHAEIVNSKAYFVARKAIWFTPKADIYKMRQQLGGIVSVTRLNRKGNTVKRRQLQLAKSARMDAPMAALILNARKGRSGIPGLYGKGMEKAIRELLGARARSDAFIKSGWLDSVQKLAPTVRDKGGAAPADTSAKRVGRPKGDAKIATEGENPVAEIVNLANARRDEKQAIILYGEPGLKQALADEEASMREYIERKMQPDANRFNSQQV